MAHDKLIKARSALLQSQPFYGALALGLEFTESANVRTTQVDGARLRFSPGYISSLRDAQVQGVVARAALRCGLLHHCRRRGRDAALWERSSGLVVNPLVAETLELEPGAEVREDFKGKSIDEVFAILDAERREQEPPQEPGEGEGEEEPGDEDAPGGGEEEGEPGDEEGEGEGQPGGAGAGEEGDGAPDARELVDAGAGGGNGEHAPTPAEMAQQEQEWTILSEQAAMMARAAGSLPGSTLQAVRPNKQAQVDWRDALRQFMAATARDDFSWSRPSRRHISSGLYLPHLRSERLGEIVIAADTSGSTIPFRQRFASETSAAIEEARPEKVHLIECDVQVAAHREMTPEDMPLDFNMRGGGGTRLAAIFEYIKAKEIEPLCVIVLTDLDNFDWGPAPDFPVLWVSTMHAKGAPFGDVVLIDGV